MDIDDYIKNRMEPQLQWFESKANRSKRSFMRFQTLIIILGAVIPLTIVFQSVLEPYLGSGWANIASATLSTMISILAGYDKLTQPQTNWLNYRANEEMLRRELWMYKFNVGAYEGIQTEERQKLLVERVENVVAADISRFTQVEYKVSDEVRNTLEEAGIKLQPSPDGEADQDKISTP